MALLLTAWKTCHPAPDRTWRSSDFSHNPLIAFAIAWKVIASTSSPYCSSPFSCTSVYWVRRGVFTCSS
eukprot:3717635-Pleurochrysis_carterae.AAC.1